MSDVDEEGELSPAAKAFLSQHQSTGEPSGEELERGLQRLTAPAAAPAPAAEAKVLPLRRKRPFLPPEVLAAAAVVTLLLGAQGLYLLLREAPVAQPDVPPKPSAARELNALSAAWAAGDYEQVKRLASRECASDECRPLASELTKMLDRAQHPDALSPEERAQLLEFDLKLSGGNGTALSRQLSRAAPEAPVIPEQLALGEQLFKEAAVEKRAKNYERAVVQLEKCVRVAPAYHPCYRLLGSVYASLAARDRSTDDMEKARKMYERFLEVAPPDDEYVPKVSAILEAARDEPEPAGGQTISLAPGQSRVVKVPGMTRIALGDPSVADVKTIGDNSLQVTGVSPGKTTMLVWTSDGRRQATLIDIRGKQRATRDPEPDSTDEAPAEGDAAITIEAGGQGMVSFGGPMSRIAVGDPEIADVEVVGQQLRLKGVHVGATTVLAWLADGQRKSIAVAVVAADSTPMAKMFQRAEQARAAGDWPRAVELAREVLKRDAGHPGARALLEQARQEARDVYQRGYQLRERSPEEARQLFSRVIALTPPEDEIHQKAMSRLAELTP